MRFVAPVIIKFFKRGLPQLAGPLVQGVDDFAHRVDNLYCRLVGRVRRGDVIDDKHTVALMQRAAEFLVQNHLRQLLFHLISGF